MGADNYYKDGGWNVYCDFCGRKRKNSDVEKTWNGFYACKHHKEKRNPQDFQVSATDNQTVPFSRPNNVPSPGPATTYTLYGWGNEQN